MKLLTTAMLLLLLLLAPQAVAAETEDAMTQFSRRTYQITALQRELAILEWKVAQAKRPLTALNHYYGSGDWNNFHAYVLSLRKSRVPRR